MLESEVRGDEELNGLKKRWAGGAEPFHYGPSELGTWGERRVGDEETEGRRDVGEGK